MTILRYLPAFGCFVGVLMVFVAAIEIFITFVNAVSPGGVLTIGIGVIGGALVINFLLGNDPEDERGV